MRGRVDVLAQDQAVPEREDVDPVPLDAAAFTVRRCRRPLADDEAVAGVEPAPREPKVGIPLEDPGDVRADVVALDTVAGGVVLEDHAGSVERDDRLDVLGVPGVVVALDRLLELGGGIPRIHAREYRTR